MSYSSAHRVTRKSYARVAIDPVAISCLNVIADIICIDTPCVDPLAESRVVLVLKVLELIVDLLVSTLGLYELEAGDKCRNDRLSCLHSFLIDINTCAVGVIQCHRFIRVTYNDYDISLRADLTAHISIRIPERTVAVAEDDQWELLAGNRGCINITVDPVLAFCHLLIVIDLIGFAELPGHIFGSFLTFDALGCRRIVHPARKLSHTALMELSCLFPSRIDDKFRNAYLISACKFRIFNFHLISPPII